MKVIVYLEVPFEVDVDTHSIELAKRAVEANWDSVFKYRANWRAGTPPNLSGKFLRLRVVGDRPAPTLPPNREMGW